MTSPGRVWIQGAGEMASGVALHLVRNGFLVVAVEIRYPKAVRRLVCFSEAVYAGSTRVQEVAGRLTDAAALEFVPGMVMTAVDPEAVALRRLSPDVVVDARMTKKRPLPLPLNGIPLIGLGPGFACGTNADLVIETHRNADLGGVISRGAAMENTGIPGKIGGQAAKRILRAPADGHLVPRRAIGDLVRKGEMLGAVGSRPLVSPLDGLLRGLVHPQAELSAGEKVGDVDPRGKDVDPAQVTDKAMAVAAGVLEALGRLGVRGR